MARHAIDAGCAAARHCANSRNASSRARLIPVRVRRCAKQGDNYHCDIVANPRAYSEGPADKLRDAARIIIGAGAGCDARFNGEPADRAYYRKIEQWDREHAAEIAAARKIWGIE